jgi:hypothetical protein
MATDPETIAANAADALWNTLWDKHEALIDYLQALNEKLSPDDRPDYEGSIRNAELEVQRIEALMDALNAGRVPPFPSEEQIEAMQTSVGKLQQAVARSAKIDKLISAATAVIKTWPVSAGG